MSDREWPERTPPVTVINNHPDEIHVIHEESLSGDALIRFHALRASIEARAWIAALVDDSTVKDKADAIVEVARLFEDYLSGAPDAESGTS